MSKMSLSCFFFSCFCKENNPLGLWGWSSPNAPNCSPLRLSFSSASFRLFFPGSERKCSCVESFGLNKKNQPIWLTFLANAIIFCCQGPTARPEQFLGSSHLYPTGRWGLSYSHIPHRGLIACFPNCGSIYGSRPKHYLPNKSIIPFVGL